MAEKGTLKLGKSRLTPAILIDNEVCPTCFDKEHGNIIYGDCSNRILFENC